MANPNNYLKRLQKGDKVHLFDKSRDKNHTFTVNVAPFKEKNGKLGQLTSLEDKDGQSLLLSYTSLSPQQIDKALSGKFYPVKYAGPVDGMQSAVTPEDITKAAKLGKDFASEKAQAAGAHDYRYQDQGGRKHEIVTKDGKMYEYYMNDPQMSKQFKLTEITRDGKQIYAPEDKTAYYQNDMATSVKNTPVGPAGNATLKDIFENDDRKRDKTINTHKDNTIKQMNRVSIDPILYSFNINKDGDLEYKARQGNETGVIKPQDDATRKAYLAVRSASPTPDKSPNVMITRNGLMLNNKRGKNGYRLMRGPKEVCSKNHPYLRANKYEDPVKPNTLMGYLNPVTPSAQGHLREDLYDKDINIYIDPDSTVTVRGAIPEVSGFYGNFDIGKGVSINHTNLSNIGKEPVKIENQGKQATVIKDSGLFHLKPSKEPISGYINRSSVDHGVVGKNVHLNHADLSYVNIGHSLVENSEIHGGSLENNTKIKDSLIWQKPQSIISNSELNKSRVENIKVADRNLERAFNGLPYSEFDPKGRFDDWDVTNILDSKLNNVSIGHDSDSSVLINNSQLHNFISTNELTADHSNVESRLSRPIVSDNGVLDHNNIKTKDYGFYIGPDESRQLKPDKSYDDKGLYNAHIRAIKPDDPSYRNMRSLKNGRYAEASDNFRTDSTDLGLSMVDGDTASIPRSSMKYYDKTKENTKANNGAHGDGATGEDSPEF